MASYNRTRHAEDLLEKHASHPPSFSVHLHPEHLVLNNVSKFSYSTPISSLLDDIRAHRIPVDFLEIFDAAKVPFYEGCMIVELFDYRQQPKVADGNADKPDRTRVVLYPNGETLFADICALNRKHGDKWTDRDALEVEARILLATSQPLCLTPDLHLTRVVNHVMRVSTPTVPNSLKRKAAVMDPEEDEVEKARKAKIMQFMAPRPGRTHAQSYKILETIQRSRIQSSSKPSTPMAATPAPAEQSQPPPPAATPSNNGVAYPPNNKRSTPKPGFSNGSPHGSANQTPSPTHNFANGVPAAAEAKRAPTPLQQQFTAASPQAPPNAQTPVQPQPPPQQPVHPTNTPRPPSAAAFQPPVPGPQFLNPPPPGRNPSIAEAQAKAAALHAANAGTPAPGQLPFAANPYQQHMYRLQPNAAAAAAAGSPPANGAVVNGRGTPRPANAVVAQTPQAAAQAKALALAAARSGRLPPGVNFPYPPHLRAASANGGAPGNPALAAQFHAAAQAQAQAQSRATASPVPNGAGAGPRQPPAAAGTAIEGGQPMPGQPQPGQPGAPQPTQQQLAQILAYNHMIRSHPAYATMGANWPRGIPPNMTPQQMAQMQQMQMYALQQQQQQQGQQAAMQQHQHAVAAGGPGAKGVQGNPGR
ncbi:hypothetical protein HMN09_01354400 [Mycena chlorophos]|uniref:Spt20-like SEP domain-containing protein n=1 Tax=Mycena chlorophos TaxID=658473 RepID=A0A8H6RZE8_MYCCL|nr:hypothetical protein HMN09_01354400 [Mycena chlorophos]